MNPCYNEPRISWTKLDSSEELFVLTEFDCSIVFSKLRCFIFFYFVTLFVKSFDWNVAKDFWYLTIVKCIAKAYVTIAMHTSNSLFCKYVM
jgi:hypothetical protein